MVTRIYRRIPTFCYSGEGCLSYAPVVKQSQKAEKKRIQTMAKSKNHITSARLPLSLFLVATVVIGRHQRRGSF